MPAESHLIEPTSTSSREGEIHSLPILILNVHENCNCRCRMCDIWKRPAGSQLSLAKAEEYVSSMKELHVKHVVLTGGEPLLHAHFEELCQILKHCGVRLTLLSTGLLLKKKAASVAAHIDDIILSLDGPEAIHNAIRRIPGAYNLMREGVTAVRSYRPNIKIHSRTTIQKANFGQLRKTVDAAQELGCNSISFLAVDTSSQAFNRELVWPTAVREQVGLNDEDVASLEWEIEALVRDYQFFFENGFIAERPEKLRGITRYFRRQMGQLPPQAPICNAPWVSAVVEVDGSVRSCFFQPIIGSTKEQSLHKSINNLTAREFRESLVISDNATCQRCVCSLNFRP